MSRVNIKADESTRERLKAVKRDGETWDGLLNRLADETEADDSEQRCAECGDVAHVWTVIDGRLLCGSCSVE